jgi:hypothetical protein
LLPGFVSSSVATNVSHLTNSDIDCHMLHDVNFNYYGVDEFRNNNDIVECFSNNNSFSALNCNIGSLSANHDKLSHMLSL